MQITLEEAAGKLAKRLKEKPEDAKGWELLARSYAELHQYSQAEAAFAEAAKRNPRDAQLLADYADAAAMANDRHFEGKPTELIERALKIDPKLPKALWLAGTLAYETRDFRKAMGYWKRLLAVVPPDSELSKQIQSDLAEVQTMLGEKPTFMPPAVAAETKPAAVAGSGPQVSGKVELSPALVSQVKANDTVFVYARPLEGPKMPLAIFKATVADLPLQFTLDDSLAMAPMAKISNHQEVMVFARVSRSGSAAPQSGDLEGKIEKVKVGSSSLKITIDHKIP
jgi:cytochrome c-type biogenesis protein CcmH